MLWDDSVGSAKGRSLGRAWAPFQSQNLKSGTHHFTYNPTVDVITDLPALNADPRVAELENQVGEHFGGWLPPFLGSQLTLPPP